MVSNKTKTLQARSVCDWMAEQIMIKPQSSTILLKNKLIILGVSRLRTLL